MQQVHDEVIAVIAKLEGCIGEEKVFPDLDGDIRSMKEALCLVQLLKLETMLGKSLAKKGKSCRENIIKYTSAFTTECKSLGNPTDWTTSSEPNLVAAAQAVL